MVSELQNKNSKSEDGLRIRYIILKKNNDYNLKRLHKIHISFIKLMLERIRIYEEKFIEQGILIL